MWNIKKIVSKGDYYYAVVTNHPKRTTNNYVLLHRVLMENHLGRILNDNEVVHHINEQKKDNRIENLEVLDFREHIRFHKFQQGKNMVVLKCPSCGEEFEREKRQTHLIKKKNNYTCCSKKCSGKLSRQIQLYGRTHQLESAISVNILRVYNTKDNTEGTRLQETP
jgi:hypothetical protein